MLQHININKSTPAVHTELNSQLLRRDLGRNSFGFAQPPLLYLKPYTKTALGSSLCNKPWLSQQGTLRTISE